MKEKLPRQHDGFSDAVNERILRISDLCVATEKHKIADRLMLGFMQSKSILNFSVTAASGTAMETNPIFIEKSLFRNKTLCSVNLIFILPISKICGPLPPRFYYMAFFRGVSNQND